MDRKIYLLLFGCLGLWSCQKEEASEVSDAGHLIYLSASVEGTQESRVPYTGTTPSREYPLVVDVWASTTNQLFKNTGQNGKKADGSEDDVALHTTAKFTNASEQLLDAAVYPKNKNGNTPPVYFVGFYPQDWINSTNDGLSATYTFDGSKDVMFAPQISGVYGGNTNAEGGKEWPVFQFKHLLTWLRFEIKAETEEVKSAWGNLKSIRIKSNNQVTVDLSKDAYNNGSFDESIVTFLSTEDDETKQVLNVYNTSHQVLSDAPIPYDKYMDVGYVLCEPVDAKAEDAETGERLGEYTLMIETAKRKLNVEIDLKTAKNTYFTGRTRKQQFTVQLLFKMGNTISVNAQAEEWKNGGIIINEVN